MSEKYIGILISLIIHSLFILIIMVVPAEKFNTNFQIIQVSIYNPSELSSDGRNMSAAKSIKPEKIVRRDSFSTIIAQSAYKEMPQETTVQKNSEIIVAEKTLPDEKSIPTQSRNAIEEPATSSEKRGISQVILFNPSKGNTKEGIIESKFGDTGSPAFIHQEIPVYPLLARRLGKEGKVLLKLLIDTTGKLQNIEVVEYAGFGFTEAAIEAVKKSTYAPGYRNGERVAMKALLPVRFQLQ